MKRKTREPIAKPILREMALRYLNYPEKTYVAEISADGVRFREKSKHAWFAVVPWDRILERSVSIQSHANALAVAPARKRVSRSLLG